MIWKNFVCICRFINVIFNVISANFNAIDAVGIYINAIFDIIVVSKCISKSCSPLVNVSQDKLKCFIYLLPKRAGIFSTVNKYRFCCTFEYTALCCDTKSSVASQNGKGNHRL